MKKRIFLFAIALVSAFNLIAQSNQQPKCPANPQPVIRFLDRGASPDFTIRTTDGDTLTLYGALNDGKTVLLDFFYTTCSYCILYSPIIEQVYQATGAGTGDILFWGLDNGDTDAEVIAYKAAHNVSNPCASGLQGNGNTVTAMYQGLYNFTGWPTYTVICPDKRVNWDVNYPPNANGFTQYFTDCAENSLIADFSSLDTLINGGDTVRFMDESLNAPTIFDWSFPGGDPSTSNMQNPVVRYDVAGIYPVSLTVSDGTYSNTKTKDSFIEVSTNVGFGKLSTPEKISILPNPNHGDFTVCGRGDFTAELINPNGLVIAVSHHSATSPAEFHNIPCGFYLLKAGQFIKKVVVE